MLRQLGSNKLEVLLVEFTLEVTVHLVIVEGPIFAQRTNKLDPAESKGSDIQTDPFQLYAAPLSHRIYSLALSKGWQINSWKSPTL